MIELKPAVMSATEQERLRLVALLLECHLAAFTIKEDVADGRMDRAYDHATAILERLTDELTVQDAFEVIH